MPVKLGSKLPTENAEARIEIVPLIDIMFFLLAAFMLISLSMVNLKNVKVNLPTATTATPDNTLKDIASISIDSRGGAYFEKRPVSDAELVRDLSTAKHANANLRVIVSGDREARHGVVIHVLDLIRAAGIDKVAFETRPPEKISIDAATPPAASTP